MENNYQSIKKEIYTQLKNFKSQDLENPETSKIDNIYSALFDANKLMIMNSGDNELIYEMLRVTLLTFKYDRTQYAIDIILPSLEKNKDLFRSALTKFSKKDSAELAKSLKIAEDFADELRKAK